MGKILEYPVLQIVKEGSFLSRTVWSLKKAYSYYSDTLQTTITVPVDFQTDLASVPRLPLLWLLAGGVGNSAAIVHDWMYTVAEIHQFTKAEGDQVFYEHLKDSKVAPWQAWLMYQAVVWFGGRKL